MRNALIGSVVGGLIVAAGMLVASQSDPAPPPSTQLVETDTVEVVVVDLVETETVSGNLRFEDARGIRSSVSGTLTALPRSGDVIGSGDVLFEIDGSPSYVMAGDRPAWRRFVDGMDPGADVAQLETELARLGLFDGEPDEEFDDVTEQAIEDWRQSVGLEEGGTIELGRVYFLSDSVRVGTLSVEVGQTVAPGLVLLEVTSLDQEVVLELDPDELDLVDEGMPVIVVLPEGDEIEGRVDRIGRSARARSPEPGSPVVVDVYVSIGDRVLDLDRAPVEVEIEIDRAAGVLAVPVRALVSLSGGGYALEVERDGSTELIGVETGEFADGLVEVSGAISEGDRVVIPR